RRLSAGDFGPALELGDGRTHGRPRRNELAELSSAFGGMALALRGREERLSAGARLSSALASSLDAETLCEQALGELIGHLRADCGAVFLRAPRSEVFCIQAILPSTGRTEPASGYGLVREAAAKRAPVFSRGGDRLTCALPMIFQDRVLGVLELETRAVLDEGALAFLEQSASLLAVSVHNALGHGRVQELAHELHDQNMQLQQQGEEIQAQNEELQSQNDELAVHRGQLETRGDELRRTVEALSRREEDYRQLFGHLSEGFAVYDVLFDEAGQPEDFRFLELNPAFERITGFAAGQTVGRTLGEVMPRSEPCLMQRVREVALSGEPARFESHVPALGKHFEVIAFTPRRARLAVLFFDVTGRKRAEEDLREADRRKNEFLGVLSHELRNPLAPIRTSLFVLDRVAAGSDAAKRAQAVIDRQVGQLSRLIDDLLDITRISRGKVRLQRGGLDLGRLAQQSADDYHPMFADRGIHFELQVPENPLWVDGDPARLSQVVGNLLQNAAKFTPRGGHVALAVEEASGMVRVRVRDDGVGIPSEMLGRLFEPFVQADQTLARSGGGLGMGLALVKGLVELHGGRVRVASEGLGGGAEFAFELPIEVARPGAAPEPRRSPSRSRRVLVIEDNVDAAESLRDALQLDGFQVELAFDGAEGLRRVRELHPDVVLCDIGLPVMNGYEVAKAVRADESLNEVFLVALTGYALPEDVRRAADAGFQQHLAKPPPIEKLEEVLGGPLH
ncbi:MAG: hybrid sensor histidine kinase/response regulator, partial [Myxococcaceae bacterium]